MSTKAGVEQLKHSQHDLARPATITVLTLSSHSPLVAMETSAFLSSRDQVSSCPSLPQPVSCNNM